MNKLVITVNNIGYVEKYVSLNNVSRLIIGNNTYGNRITMNYEIEDIKKASSLVHLAEKELYVAINKLFHQSEIENLEAYVKSLISTNIDGIIFSDFAVYEIVKKLDFDINLIYSTDTTITNSYFTLLAKENQIESVFLAKELTLEEIKEINDKKFCKIGMFIHGHIYMYNTYRQLISTYFENEGIKEISPEGEFYLYDDERDAIYPIVQNSKGTNILSADDQMSLKYLSDILSYNIEWLIIDGFLYEDEDYLLILEIYNELINLYNSSNFENTEELLTFKEVCNQKAKEIKDSIKYKKFSNGFLKKETVF